jgi:hypothetical protein
MSKESSGNTFTETITKSSFRIEHEFYQHLGFLNMNK